MFLKLSTPYFLRTHDAKRQILEWSTYITVNKIIYLYRDETAKDPLLLTLINFNPNTDR